MIYDADLRRQFKGGARRSISEAFGATMLASLLAILPSGLVTFIYNRSLPAPGVEDTFAVMMSMFRVFGIAAALFGIVQLFVLTPIQFGAMHYFTSRARGEEAPTSLVFGCFGDGRAYVTAVKLAICIFIRSLGWYILEAVVASALIVAVMFGSTNEVVFTLLLCVMVVAVVVLSAVASVKIRRYDGAYIRLIDEPEMSVWKATGECAATFKDHNFELFVFDLSFWLWEIGIVVTFGILWIYVNAYMNMAFVNYFDALREYETGINRRAAKSDNLPPL